MLSLLPLTLESLTHRPSMHLPMATPKTKPFSFFTYIGWKLPAGFSWLCFPLECCDWCCFWSGFYLYIYVCSLCPVPGPWALLGLSDQEGAWETAHSLRSRLLLWSWQRHFLPHPICLKSLINYRCFQGALAWGRKRKWSLPIEWSLEGWWKEGWVIQQRKMPWNLAVRRFLLAVILVSGSETAVQNQLLTVWVAVCWCQGIISPTTVPSNLLPGIVSKKTKEKKICH